MSKQTKELVGGFISNFIGKWIGRKIIIVGLSTWLLYVGKLPAEYWTIIAGIYMGVNLLAKLKQDK